jgi:hypothetical protein
MFLRNSRMEAATANENTDVFSLAVKEIILNFATLNN